MDFISQFAVSLDAILGEDMDTILYLDSHTHRTEDADNVMSVLNCYPGELCKQFSMHDSQFTSEHMNSRSLCLSSNLLSHTSRLSALYSIGLHPWHVGRDWRDKVEIMRSEAFSPFVCAIGECGLDKCVDGDYCAQKEAFRAQVLLAEELEKPMIVHCVRAFDDLFAIHKEMKPRQKWLIHGFRGKPELAKQIMAKGLLLSFGHHYNVNSLVYVASTCQSLYLETDDCDLSIRQIYEQVSRHLSSLRN